MYSLYPHEASKRYNSKQNFFILTIQEATKYILKEHCIYCRSIAALIKVHIMQNVLLFKPNILSQLNLLQNMISFEC